jgi:hypothetical protein
MGPSGLYKAMPNGGRFIDDYPASHSNYIDGILEDHWIENKVAGCTLENANKMSGYVGQTIILCQMKILMIKSTDIWTTHGTLSNT